MRQHEREYQSPQEQEAGRRQKASAIQKRERALSKSTRKRKTRYCREPGCGMPFGYTPGSIQKYCVTHDSLSKYSEEELQGGGV